MNNCHNCDRSFCGSQATFSVFCNSWSLFMNKDGQGNPTSFIYMLLPVSYQEQIFLTLLQDVLVYAFSCAVDNR